MSVAGFYGIGTSELCNFLHRLDLDSDLGGSEELLRARFELSFGVDHEDMESVCWFHITRVPQGVSFAEGILPLHLVRERLWDAIIEIPQSGRTRANLRKMQREGVEDFHYNLKIDKLHSGPYAMLVRESAFHAEALGYCDYLRSPETIEDICNGYYAEFKENIFEEISRALRQCIVKFKSSKDTADSLITAALAYCWYKANSAELSRSVLADFDAGGEPIPVSSILGVEFL